MIIQTITLLLFLCLTSTSIVKCLTILGIPIVLSAYTVLAIAVLIFVGMLCLILAVSVGMKVFQDGYRKEQVQIAEEMMQKMSERVESTTKDESDNS